MMDIYSAILVVVPMLYPVAMRFGVDPVHLAVIILVNLEIGYLTPPVGINLFIASLRFSRPVPVLYRASLPFISLLLVCLVVVTWVPELSLGLVRARENTGQVVMRVAHREAVGEVAGRFRWGKRLPGATTDPDTFLEPSTAANSQDLQDSRISFDATSQVLRLSIASKEGTRIDGIWSCSLAGLPGQRLSGEVVQQLNIAIDDAELKPILGGDAQVFGSELFIHSIVDSVIIGELHLTVLYFPEDPNAADVVWDYWAEFRSPLNSVRPVPRIVETVASTMTIDHVRGIWRSSSEGASAGLLTLETMRNKPVEFSLQVPFTPTSGIFPQEIALSEDQLRLFVTYTEGLPRLAGKLRVLASTLTLESLSEDRVVGILRAVLSPAAGAQLFDAEWRIDLPYHR
jgi:hypothetical protein